MDKKLPKELVSFVLLGILIGFVVSFRYGGNYFYTFSVLGLLLGIILSKIKNKKLLDEQEDTNKKSSFLGFLVFVFAVVFGWIMLNVFVPYIFSLLGQA